MLHFINQYLIYTHHLYSIWTKKSSIYLFFSLILSLSLYLDLLSTSLYVHEFLSENLTKVMLYSFFEYSKIFLKYLLLIWQMWSKYGAKYRILRLSTTRLYCKLENVWMVNIVFKNRLVHYQDHNKFKLIVLYTKTHFYCLYVESSAVVQFNIFQ